MMPGGVWSVFGAFSITLSAIAVFLIPMHVTLITVEKGFKGKMPRTTCRITPAGQEECISVSSGKEASDDAFHRRPTALGVAQQFLTLLFCRNAPTASPVEGCRVIFRIQGDFSVIV